jgi:hypothetical protein
MRHLAKILARLVVLLLLVVGGAYWYLSTLDVGEYRGDIAAAVKQATGRNFQIAGEFSLDVFPTPKLVAEGLALSNADWGSLRDFITVDRLEAEISLADLLGGTVGVTRIAILGPVVFLETDAKGNGNWDFSTGEPEKVGDPKASSGISVDISNVEIRDARVTYRDGVKNTIRMANIKELLVKSSGWRQPLGIEMRGQIDEREFEVTGDTESLAALLGNEPYQFDLVLRVLANELHANGAVKEPMKGRGIAATLSLKSPKLSDLVNLFGASSDMTVPVEASASVRDVDDGYLAEDLKLKLGKSDLSGEVSYATIKGRPQVKSALQSTLLDLDELSSPDGKRKSYRVIPGDPLPVDALRALDADVSFKGARVISAGMEINALILDLKLRNGRLALTPGGRLYGGEFSGRIGLDAAGERPRFETDLKARQISLGALVNAVGRQDLMSGGPTDISLKLNGRGATPRQIAASANGLLVSTIGAGKIHTSVVEKVGADALMQVIRAASSEGQSDYTGFECGVARFEIEKGKAVTKRGIAVQNVRMNVIGSGTVDLGTEALDIAIKTEPREGAGLSVSAVGLAVRVGGTLGNPETALDSLGAAKAGASAAAAVATGGLSLLGQALFSRATADDTPCDTALGIKRKTTRQAESTSQASSTTQENSGSASSTSPVDALKGVGDAIKGLFGN